MTLAIVVDSPAYPMSRTSVSSASLEGGLFVHVIWAYSPDPRSV